MEETYTSKAIILNRLPFREYDVKAAVYSPDKGKLELVVRGVKKLKSKLAGHIEPINLVNIMVVRGRQFNYIGSAMNERCYANIKNDYDKACCAGQAVGLMDKLIKEGDETDAGFFFSLLKEFLNVLDKDKSLFKNYELFFSFFALKLLAGLGYQPELRNCLKCEKKIAPDKNNFDLARGGLICRSCIKGGNNLLTISDNCIKVLRLVSESNFEKLLRLKMDSKLNKETVRIISSFHQYCAA